MNMKRLVTLVCALLLALTAFSFASAEKDAVDKYFEGHSYYLVKNGKTANFYVFAGSSPWEFYDSKGNSYRDFVFDCDGKVTAKVTSGTEWLTTNKLGSSFTIRVATNPTLKKRTGKILVTGTNFKATLKITQYGTDRILSVVRKKKTVTMKFKLSSGAKAHRLYVQASKNTDTDGWEMFKFIYDGNFTKSSFKFTAEKGINYYFGIGPAIHYTDEWNDYYNSDSTSWGDMQVDSLTGTQEPDNLGSYADYAD